MVSLYNTATEYIACEITLNRGVEGDIVSVGMALESSPATVPAVAAFTAALLIGPQTSPTSPLLDGTKIDLVAKVGPGAGAVVAGHFPSLTPGDYQVWTLVTTADEHVIRRPGVLTVS